MKSSLQLNILLPSNLWCIVRVYVRVRCRSQEVLNGKN